MEAWPDELDDLVDHIEIAIEEVHNAAITADELDMDIFRELSRIKQELEGLLLAILPSDSDNL